MHLIIYIIYVRLRIIREFRGVKLVLSHCTQFNMIGRLWLPCYPTSMR